MVDQIEDGKFAPPGIESLKRLELRGESFATRVCRNCDARFSCVSYREYGGVRGQKWTRAFEAFVSEGLSPDDLEEWRELVLEEE